MPQTHVPQILIVDDALDIREPLGQFVQKNGFRVRLAANAETARKIMNDWAIDLVILDIMMPDEVGFSLGKYIAENAIAPIIFLTALVDEENLMAGLEVGDDYVTKPFNPRELLARIHAVLRRSSRATPRIIPFPDQDKRAFGTFVHIASKQRLLTEDGAQIELTTGENKLLSTLLDHPNTALSRTRLLDAVRGREAHAYDRAVDNLISRLRKKVGDDRKPYELIVTDWGGGYRLAASVETPT